MKNLFLPIILLFSVITTVCAANYRMQSIDSRNGLSNSAVLSLYQDPKGYVWVGTYNGLNRYDGKFVESFYLGEDGNGTQSSNIIQKIQGADANHLWVSAYMGLSKFSTTLNKVVENYPSYSSPYNLATNGKQLTCLVAKRRFISVYDKTGKRFVDVPSPDIDPLKVITTFIDQKNDLWVFTSDNQVWTMNITWSSSQSKPVIKPRIRKINALPIVKVYEENGIIFFVDTTGNLFSYDIDRERSTYIRNIKGLLFQYGNLSSIIAYHDDLLISFSGSGIFKLVAANKYAEQMLDFSSGVFCMHKDKNQDVVMIGSDGQGLVIYSQKMSIFNTIKSESLPFRVSKPIRSIYTDKYNALWIGTKGDGLIRISDYDKFEDQSIPKSHVKHYTMREGLTSNQVYDIVSSRFHDINWLATEGPGLSYYSYKDQEIHTLLNGTSSPIIAVHSVLEESDTTLWLATSDYGFLKVNYKKAGQVFKVTNIDTYLFKRGKKIVRDFFSMLKDKNGIFWIGSRGDGVIRFDPIKKSYHFLTTGKGFNSTTDDILSTCFSTDSMLYFGSSAGLVKIIRASGKMKLEGISNNNYGNTMREMIHGMQLDKTGCIWMSTNRGLLKYNPLNDDFNKYINHTGLDVIEFSDNADYTCPYTDRIFFGGIDGLVWIEQNIPNDKGIQPPIYFDGLKLNGRKMVLTDFMKKGKKGDYLELTHHQNSFSVSFIAIDYLHGSNMEYLYSMENYNNEWINANDLNEASFNALPPGHYILKVKCKNDIFDNESKLYSLTIVILPPWYLSFLALIIYSLLFIGLIVFSIFYFQKNIRKKQQEFNKLIIEKNKEVLYETKMKFFTNITHEFLTPLTLIQGPSERILTYKNSDEYILKYASILHMNVDRLQLLIHEIINFSKQVEFGNYERTVGRVHLNPVVKSIHLGFSEIIESNLIDFKVEMEEGLYWNTDVSCLNKILMNLISNAFKYTPQGGKITVSLKKAEDELVIVVYNTGKGIPKNEIRKVFDRFRILDNMENEESLDSFSRNGLGLSICYNMTQLLKGQVHVKSEEGKFAEFTVQLPYLPLTVKLKEVSLNQPTEKQEESNTKKPEAISSSKKILVVDDNRDIVWMVSELMSDKYQIIKAYNVQEALILLDNDLPELIVTDLIMPGDLDGADLIRRLKSNRFTSHIPIIVVSAKNTMEDQMEGMEYGADLYVTKPFSLSYLRTMIEHLIDKKSVLRDYFNSPLSAVELKGGQLIHQEEQDLLMQVNRIIDENLSKGELRPELIAEMLKLSPQVFYRRFKAISSLSPSEFVKKYRFAVAAKLLISTSLSVQEVIYKVGINNRSYFYREFSKIYHTTPKDYRLLKKKEQFDGFME